MSKIVEEYVRRWLVGVINLIGELEVNEAAVVVAEKDRNATCGKLTDAKIELRKSLKNAREYYVETDKGLVYQIKPDKGIGVNIRRLNISKPKK